MNVDSVYRKHCINLDEDHVMISCTVQGSILRLHEASAKCTCLHVVHRVNYNYM